MNEPLKPHRTLAEWSLPRTVIRGPYADGETEHDKKLRLDREEGERTAKLVGQVIVVMACLIALYVVFWICFHQK